MLGRHPLRLASAAMKLVFLHGRAFIAESRDRGMVSG
jgi:hypothetical protein